MKPCPRLVAIAAALGAVLSAPFVHAQPASPPEPAKITTFTLPNGLTVAHSLRPGSLIVSVQLWVRAGTREEPAGKRGVARLFEHLAFAGSDKLRAGDHRKFIAAGGGFSDAFVVEDAAAFNDTVPVQHLDLALELAAQRLRHLVLLPDGVADAKERVKDAVKRSQGSAFFRALVVFLERAFTTHPYGKTSGGTEAEIDKLTVADVRAFYDSRYVPGNALLVIAGAIDEATARDAVQRHFGGVAKGKPPAALPVEPAQTEGRRDQQEWPVGLGFALVGYRIPEAKHEDVNTLQVLSLLLSRGKAGRLRKAFDADKQVRGASAEALVREHPGLFVAYAAFSPGADPAAIETKLVAEVERYAKAPPAAKELERAKNQLAGTLALTLDGLTGFARQIGQSWVLTGNPAHFVADLAAFKKVTPAAITAVAKKYLVAKNRTVLVLLPGAGQ